MDGQVIREVDRLDPFKALSKMRLHAQWVLDSPSKRERGTYDDVAARAVNPIFAKQRKIVHERPNLANFFCASVRVE